MDDTKETIARLKTLSNDQFWKDPFVVDFLKTTSAKDIGWAGVPAPGGIAISFVDALVEGVKTGTVAGYKAVNAMLVGEDDIPGAIQGVLDASVPRVKAAIVEQSVARAKAASAEQSRLAMRTPGGLGRQMGTEDEKLIWVLRSVKITTANMAFVVRLIDSMGIDTLPTWPHLKDSALAYYGPAYIELVVACASALFTGGVFALGTPDGEPKARTAGLVLSMFKSISGGLEGQPGPVAKALHDFVNMEDSAKSILGMLSRRLKGEKTPAMLRVLLNAMVVSGAGKDRLSQHPSRVVEFLEKLGFPKASWSVWHEMAREYDSADMEGYARDLASAAVKFGVSARQNYNRSDSPFTHARLAISANCWTPLNLLNYTKKVVTNTTYKRETDGSITAKFDIGGGITVAGLAQTYCN